MKRKTCAIIFAVLLAFTVFSGCGKSVSLTEQESEIISRYAASLLLKYDVNYQNVLKAEEVENEDLEEERAEQEIPAQEDSKQESSGQTTAAEGIPGNTPEEETAVCLEELLGLNGLQIAYQGCDFVSSYPNEKNGSFFVKAEEGSRLAILKFTITNNAAETVKCDILTGQPAFSAVVNGVSQPVHMTILPDDLSTSCEEIAPGVSVEKVLACQVSESVGETVDTLELKVASGGRSGSVVLVP